MPGGVPELKANGEQGKDKTQQFLQCFLLLPMVTRATQSQFQSCPFPSVPITPQQTIILSHTSSARCVSVGQSCPSSSFLHVHLRSLPSSSFKHMQRSPWEFPAHSVGYICILDVILRRDFMGCSVIIPALLESLESERNTKINRHGKAENLPWCCCSFHPFSANQSASKHNANCLFI